MWDQSKTMFLEGVERVSLALARILPGLLVMLLLVLFSALLAFVASWLVRRLGGRLEVDRRLREWGMAPPARSDRLGPTGVTARVAAWTVVTIGFLVGLSVLESHATSALALRLLDYIPHALVGVVILAVGQAAARALERSVLIGAVNMGFHSARLLGLGARWLLLVLAAAMAFEHFGIGGTILTAAFSILFGGIVLAMALAIGLGAREVVARSLERRFQEPPEKKDPAGGDDLHHL